MSLSALFRWPRGRFNGQPIVGLCLKAKLNLWYWRVLPTARCQHGQIGNSNAAAFSSATC